MMRTWGTTKTQRHEEQPRGLPDGWRWVRLGDVAHVVNGVGFPEHLQGRTDLPYLFVKVSDMNAPGAERVISEAANTVDGDLLRQLRGRVYPQGTIVFPKVGGALLTNKKRILGRAGCFDNNVMGLVPQGIDGPFLFLWFCTVDLRKLSNTQALPSVRMSAVANLAVPVPPLAEQKRIAAILNEQMAAVERARAAAQAQLEEAKALPAAYLRQVFPRPGEELPAGWRWVRLGDVAHVVNGVGFPEHLQGRTDLPYLFVKVSDMNAPGAERVISEAANTVDGDLLRQLRGRVYPQGTIVFPKVGGALLTNKKRILGRAGCFDNNVMGLVPQGIDGDFLFSWFCTVDLRKLSNTQALPSVRMSAVANLAVPVPPLPEQKRIAAILSEQMAAVERAQAAAQAQLAEINALPAALLRRAFSGEL